MRRTNADPDLLIAFKDGVFDAVGRKIAQLSKGTVEINLCRQKHMQVFVLLVKEPVFGWVKKTVSYTLTNADMENQCLFYIKRTIENLREDLALLLKMVMAFYENHIYACDAIKPFYETLLTLSKSLEALKGSLTQDLISTIDFTPLLTYAKEYNNQTSAAFKSADKALDAASDAMPLLLTTTFANKVLALVDKVTDQQKSTLNPDTVNKEEILKNTFMIYDKKLAALLTAHKEKEFAESPKDACPIKNVPNDALMHIFFFVFTNDLKNVNFILQNTNVEPRYKKWYSVILNLSLVNKKFNTIINSFQFNQMACRLLPNRDELLLINKRLLSEPKNNLIDSIAKNMNPVYVFGIPMLLLLAAEWKVKGVKNSVLEWLPKMVPSLLEKLDIKEEEHSLNYLQNFKFGNLFARHIFNNLFIATYLEKWAYANTPSLDTALASLLFRKNLLGFTPNTAARNTLCDVIFTSNIPIDLTTLAIMEEKDLSLFHLKFLILKAYHYYDSKTQPTVNPYEQYHFFYKLYRNKIINNVSPKARLSILELANDVTQNPATPSPMFFKKFVTPLENGTLEELVFVDNDAKSLKN